MRAGHERGHGQELNSERRSSQAEEHAVIRIWLSGASSSWTERRVSNGVSTQDRWESNGSRAEKPYYPNVEVSSAQSQMQPARGGGSKNRTRCETDDQSEPSSRDLEEDFHGDNFGLPGTEGGENSPSTYERHR